MKQRVATAQLEPQEGLGSGTGVKGDGRCSYEGQECRGPGAPGQGVEETTQQTG